MTISDIATVDQVYGTLSIYQFRENSHKMCQCSGKCVNATPAYNRIDQLIITGSVFVCHTCGTIIVMYRHVQFDSGLTGILHGRSRVQ